MLRNKDFKILQKDYFTMFVLLYTYLEVIFLSLVMNQLKPAMIAF